MDETVTGIEVQYFAAAADAAGVDKEIVALPPSTDLRSLKAALIDRHGADMARVLSVAGFLIGSDLTRDLAWIAGPVVGVLPPFAGG
ncbi:molybdenum cofactor biosynthesis protein MoaD (plasmid) [Rhodococcus erythropolis]|uniref:MoaD/ThiS family protein n=1 Tax=Rhodococcus erythropolis TaxID=1833 RepID=UPI00061B62AD|nr:molybdenum cofactor biosynthesis protein MoaD [Rhodococcus erythropolis]AKE01149.1 molybdenum cofactor biosynthesis protein MoaD [Rhodococcus erythropolis]